MRRRRFASAVGQPRENQSIAVFTHYNSQQQRFPETVPWVSVRSREVDSHGRTSTGRTRTKQSRSRTEGAADQRRRRSGPA
jgi:hypothetical protein